MTSRFDFFREVLDRAGAEPPPDIVVVGSGVRVPGQFTRESVEALRGCRRIYTLLPQIGLTDFLREIGPPVEDISSLYQTGRPRLEVYEQVTGIVLGRAADGGPVGYVTAGNPILFDQTTRAVLAGAEHRGLVAKVYPGVSIVDTMLVDLEHDIGATGLQIFGASWMIGHGLLPNPNVPCIVLQINVFGTAYATEGTELRAGALTPLRDHLLQVYPPEHELVFVESPVFWFERPRQPRVPLSELGNVGPGESVAPSLFIPPASTPAVVNQMFANRMYDPGYFAEAYRPLTWPAMPPQRED
jgi:uncharacterized protein YabN with tetrapyrrole methylase and pyrophosphatase domain